MLFLWQGHRGLPGKLGDSGRQGNWVNKYILPVIHASMCLASWIHFLMFTRCLLSMSSIHFLLLHPKELSWLVGEWHCKTCIRETAAKLWKMATEAQLRQDRMETDLEAEQLSNSKHVLFFFVFWKLMSALLKILEEARKPTRMWQ